MSKNNGTAGDVLFLVLFIILGLYLYALASK